jgi:dynein heavy chain 1
MSVRYICLIISRFYFVGDEDLLEIIGNSKNVGRLQKHFKKMFAGVATITLNEDNSQVTGLLSKEGEEVGSSFIMTCKVLHCWKPYNY